MKIPRSQGGNSFLESSKLLGSFCNEIRLLRRIRHANVVAFYGASLDPSTGDIAMLFECVPGLRMGAFVAAAHQDGHALSSGGAPMAVLLFDIGLALTYLHALEPTVVHGDIKESNIKVYQYQQEFHHAKLLDFGLSRLLTRHARPLGGTTPWMAPELFREDGSDVRPRPSPNADIYSFGLLTHFAMTGIFVKESFDERELKRRYERLTWPETTPMAVDCQKLCADCLAEAPAHRPQMRFVVERIAHLLRQSGADYELLGKSRVQLLASADSWDAGLRKLRSMQDAEEAHERSVDSTVESA